MYMYLVSAIDPPMLGSFFRVRAYNYYLKTSFLKTVIPHEVKPWFILGTERPYDPIALFSVAT